MLVEFVEPMVEDPIVKQMDVLIIPFPKAYVYLMEYYIWKCRLK